MSIASRSRADMRPTTIEPPRHSDARRTVGVWLLCCCILVAAMVVLGGVTRLTGSGLSMVTWKPIHGIVPPIGASQWEEEFARYRGSPEYREINAGMTLADFKRIFWFEYAHRLLGRAIGIAFLLPLVWLLFKRMVAPRLVPKLVIMFALGGAQGLLGWWMVKSGLVDVPRVSAYRLTAHLALAVGLYVWMLWTALDQLLGPPAPTSTRHKPIAFGVRCLLALALLTVLSGGFVAGLHAGKVYNTFPTMGEYWVPPEIAAMSPWWRNLFENVVTVQFNHRILASLLLVGAIALWIASLAKALPRGARGWIHAVLIAATLQLVLGILTLLQHVPIVLASLHQANALVLLSFLVAAASRIGWPIRTAN